MSFANRVLLWLHIGFVIFAIGPVTIATMSTPRYIRTRNLAVTAYLYQITRVFSAVSLGVLLFGIILANTEHKISHPWVSVSMTLFVVAAVLLVLIMRDQHKAIDALKIIEAQGGGNTATAPGTAVALTTADEAAQPGPASPAQAAEAATAGPAGQPGSIAQPPGAAGPATATTEDGEQLPAASEPGDNAAASPAPPAADPAPVSEQPTATHIAAVERGRIASMGGVVSLIWLVTLVLMVWNS